MLAFKAFNSDISPEPDHLPLIATTGVLLPQANHIAQPYLHGHFPLPHLTCQLLLAPIELVRLIL